MADKQFALGGTRSAGYVEDEDPLAELARIVGFQEQPAVKQRPEASAPQQRREPVLAEFPAAAHAQPQASTIPNPVADLEDELLRAFEVYDAPRTETVPPPAVNVNVPPVRTEPVVVPPQPSSAVAAAQPNEDDDPFAALAAVVAAQPEPVRPAAAPMAQQRREPAFEAPVAPAVTAGPVAPAVQDEPVFSVDLLEQELLESLGEAEIATPAPVTAQAPAVAPVPEVKPAASGRQAATSFRSDGSFRLPMATFHKPQPRVEPQTAQPVAEPYAPAPFTVAETSATREEPELGWELPGLEVDDLVVSEPPVAAAPARSAPDTPTMDGLLDDVARYEVPVSRAAPATQPRDPAFMASLAAITGVATQIGQPQEKAPEPDMRRAPETAWAPKGDEHSAKTDEPDLGDLFGPGDFELDLDAFEQQLTDLSFEEQARPNPPHQRTESAEPRLEPFADFVSESEAHGADHHAEVPVELAAEAPVYTARGSASDRAPVQPQAAATQTAMPREPAPLDFSDLDFTAPERRQPAEAPRREPVAVVQPAIPVPDYTIDETAPFDPAMLAESEDAVESVGEIDVPEIQPQVDEEPAVVVPEYDLDIDAEMANLFGSLPPITGSTQGAKAGVSSTMAEAPISATGFGAAPKPAASQPDGFDEFERALEDDFRSMLSQPLGQPQAISGAPLQPPEAYRTQSSGRTLRAVLLAACATGVLAVAGVGGYFLLSGGVREIASTEPRVITADKGPVKVVPENPGGVTVPNQDKAVYDRVAGKEADIVKQEQLVTTNEEPVDVVQKTLVPENTLANEAEAEVPAVATPVEDTKDARLLPSDAAAQAPAGSDQSAAPGGVSVRKVRTMIVKPDGTLVPRDDAASDPSPAPVDTAATTAASAAKTPAATVPVSAATTPPPADIRTTDTAPAAQPTPDDAGASAEALATVANSNVEAQPPVKVVKTAKASDAAPVPQARPADQPVTVTDTVTETGKVRPAATAQQTAAAEPAPQAAAPSGSYGIQIASLPSEADAKASIPKMSAKFGGVLGGRSIGIRKADIAGKGTYYRLRVDVGSKEDAVNLCLKLKAAGGSCLVSK